MGLLMNELKRVDDLKENENDAMIDQNLSILAFYKTNCFVFK